MNRKAKYSVGDIFKISLDNKKIAIGINIRADFKGSVLGYFYLLKKENSINVTQINFHKEEIVFKCKFGDLGLIKETWSIIGHVEKDHKVLKLPVKGFYRFDNEDGKYYISQYDNNLQFLGEKKVSKIPDTSDFIEDSLYGYGLVEKLLLKK